MPNSVETKPRELDESKRFEDEEILRAERSRSVKRSRLRWVIVLAAVVVVAAVFFLWQYYSVRESTDDAQIEAHIHSISARVGGTLIQVAVDNNQIVEAGALLAQIDPRDYQVALDKAEADLADAEATWHASESEVPITSETSGSKLSGSEAGLAEARASLQSAQQDEQGSQARLTVAQAHLREAEANSQKSSRDLDRMRTLIAKDEISQQQYDAAVAASASFTAAAEAAKASVTDAELGVREAASNVALQEAKQQQAESMVQAAKTAPQQVAQMRARADSAQAKWELAKTNVEQAKLNLEYATIRAPIRGVVSKKAIETGQVVSPAQPLLAIIPLDNIWVSANFKETQLKDMRIGQKAAISVDAYGGREYQGHVDSIAAATGARFSLLPPENATGNYVKVVQRVPVKIVLDQGQDPEHLLRPGMSVVATVMTH